MNSQIVLCKGYNDGEELENTIHDLTKYIPHMESLSVVPFKYYAEIPISSEISTLTFKKKQILSIRYIG